MTKATVLLPSFSHALDEVIKMASPDGLPEPVAEFRKEFDLDQWEDTVRRLPGRAAIFFSESEEDDFREMGWLVGAMVRTIYAEAPKSSKTVIWENKETGCIVEMVKVPYQDITIVSFTDCWFQEGGALTTFIFSGGLS